MEEEGDQPLDDALVTAAGQRSEPGDRSLVEHGIGVIGSPGRLCPRRRQLSVGGVGPTVRIDYLEKAGDVEWFGQVVGGAVGPQALDLPGGGIGTDHHYRYGC